MTSWVGQSVARVDGPAKVLGLAAYVDDFFVPGALHGATVRSDVPRGRLRGIVRDPAFDWSGITVVTHEDLPSDNVVVLIEDDQPILAAKEIKHCYEPVALVACADPLRLMRAVKAIKVDVDPRSPILTMDDSLAARDVIHG